MLIDCLVKDVEKGIQGIGLRRQVQPETLIQACECITSGSSEDITHIMRDIGGEAFSLAVGQTEMGAQALDALGQAQSMSLVFLRKEKYDGLTAADMKGISTLLDEHRANLTGWIDTGLDQEGGSESDLSQIGLLIETPDLRLAAIAFYVAVLQVMSSTFALFTISNA